MNAQQIIQSLPNDVLCNVLSFIELKLYRLPYFRMLSAEEKVQVLMKLMYGYFTSDESLHDRTVFQVFRCISVPYDFPAVCLRFAALCSLRFNSDPQRKKQLIFSKIHDILDNNKSIDSITVNSGSTTTCDTSCFKGRTWKKLWIEFQSGLTSVLANVEEQGKIQHLFLGNAKDENYQTFASFKHLKSCEIFGTKAAEVVNELLYGNSIRSLIIRSNYVDSLSALSTNTSLRSLQIGGMHDDILNSSSITALNIDKPVSDQQLLNLVKLPSLRKLSIKGSSLTDQALNEAAQLAQQLEVLDIDLPAMRSDIESFSDATAITISKMSSLKELRMNYTKFSSTSFSAIAAMPKLTHLHLSRNNAYCDKGLELAFGVPRTIMLTSIDLTLCTITDAGVRVLIQSNSVLKLNLSRTRISDEALQDLHMNTTIECLDLTSIRLTGQYLPDLVNSKSLRRLKLVGCKIPKPTITVLTQLFTPFIVQFDAI